MLNARLLIYQTLSIASAILAFALPAFSQDREQISSAEAPGLIRHVHIETSDQVSGGCWTNSGNIEARLRLLFEQNGINVELEKLVFYDATTRLVVVNVVGYRISGGVCVGSAEFEVLHPASYTLGGYDGLPGFGVAGLIVSSPKGAVFTSSGNLNQQASDFFEEAATSFVADILSGRRSEAVQLFRKTYPSYGASILTETEWQGILDTASAND